MSNPTDFCNIGGYGIVYCNYTMYSWHNVVNFPALALNNDYVRSRNFDFGKAILLIGLKRKGGKVHERVQNHI